MFLAAKTKNLTHPDTGKPLPAKALGGPEIPFQQGKDMREALFNWMRSPDNPFRSEEHTSELQSLAYLVCRLLLEKKKMRRQTRAPASFAARGLPASRGDATPGSRRPKKTATRIERVPDAPPQRPQSPPGTRLQA